MTEGISSTTISFPDKIFNELKAKKKKKGLGWEDWIIWLAENSK